MLTLFDTNTRFRYIVLIALSLAAAVSIGYNLYRSQDPANEWGSFDMQWDVARVIVMRQNPYTFYLTQQPAPTEEIVGHGILPRQLPSVVALLVPYALFDWPVARLLWALSNILFGAGWVAALMLLYEERIRPTRFLLWFTLLCTTLYWGAIVWVGQHTLAALFFFTLSLLYLKRKNAWGAGLFIALSLIKYHLTAPLLLIYLYKRAYRPLFIAAGIHLVLTLIVAAWLGENPVSLVLSTFSTSSALLSDGHYHIFALVLRGAERFGMGENVLIPSIVSGVLMLATLAVTLYASRKPSAEREVRLLILLVLVSLVWIYHRSYDWMAYYFILYFALSGQVSGKWLPRWLLFICVLEMYVMLFIPTDNDTLIRLSFWPRAAFHYLTMFYLLIDQVRPWRSVQVTTPPLATPEPASS